MRQSFSSCVVILIYNKRVMELTCALLHPDARMVEKLQEWMKDMPFLRLCGCYTDTLESLRAYCVSRVDVYVVGIVPVSAGEVGGMDFCRMLSPHTRVIFIADREGYAAECFRLDALDYLVEKDLRFATFFQAVNKAICQPYIPAVGHRQPFRTEAEALETGRLVCRKLRHGLPPALTCEEVEACLKRAGQ